MYGNLRDSASCDLIVNFVSGDCTEAGIFGYMGGRDSAVCHDSSCVCGNHYHYKERRTHPYFVFCGNAAPKNPESDRDGYVSDRDSSGAGIFLLLLLRSEYRGKRPV